jgi:predicted aspartyl protease
MRTLMRTAAALALVLASGCTQPPPATSAATQASYQGGMQGTPIEFRVVASGRNPAACQQFDAALSRVHTFTPAGATATLRTAGGVTSNMTQTTPGVFTTTLGIGGTNFNVVADTSRSPKALDVTEPRLGCRWNAVAP